MSASTGASQSHQVCLVDAGGECLGERAVAHGGADIAELCDWLLTRTAAAPEAIAVAIEVPQGPVVEALLERGFRVYAINPSSSIGSATVLPSPAPKMTDATPTCWPTACAPIGTPFDPCRPIIR